MVALCSLTCYLTPELGSLYLLTELNSWEVGSDGDQELTNQGDFRNSLSSLSVKISSSWKEIHLSFWINMTI